MVEIASDPEFGHGRVGVELRHAREAQGLDLAEVADRTRVPVRHLAAIESGAYDGLPATTYSAGFVRSYARLLGLDGAALSNRFRQEMNGREVPTQRYEPYEPADPARTPSRWLAWGTLGFAVVLLLGYLYWRGMEAGENPAAVATQAQVAPPPASPAPATPAPAPVQPAAGAPAPATAAPAPGTAALLTAEQPVWLRVTDGPAKLFQGMLQPGDHFAVPATATDPRLRTSRVTALKVTVGATVIPPLGPPETLVKDVSLAPQALLARSAPPAP